ncbi:MAG TPA: flagellar biosynthesis protein FlhB [Vicinamibacterales bacterium]|jgi:flagellar biosynthetic protein FlhB|nr:flagellar biosynthesis protein FlhB [Vicinamibacterales bacterium]
MAAGEKTEKPTSKRLKDARKKGQIPRSKDLAMAAATVAATFALARMGGRVVTALTERVSGDLSHFGDHPLRDITGPQMAAMAVGGAQLIAMVVGPIALVTMTAAVGMHGFQGGWNFAPESLQFNWSRLNPGQGLKRFKVTQTGPDMLKNLVSVAVVGYLGYGVASAVISETQRFPWLSPGGSASVAWAHTEKLLWQIGFALAFLAIFDYGLQRYRMMKQLKMTKQELKSEAKESEGNAEVKGRIRRIQRDMARKRMIADVKKATVVITNPTHFAVALQYNRESMLAPKVLAKGRDILAARIREEARKHEIPIVENKPLAQALFKTVEIGETIPAQLFAAVAEVLAYLVRIKQLML